MSKPHGFTWIELLAVTALFAVAIALFIPYLAHKRAEASRAICANNLRQLGVTFRMYANENKDCYPAFTRRYRIQPKQGVSPWLLLPDEQALFPKYLTDPAVFLCPNAPDARRVLAEGGDWVGENGAFDPNRLDDRSYV